ncbi:MAG: hypothetical protein P4L83_10310 [Nevskia sp.]|nr:hypothetical protein [Nevskia sp.]
MRLRTALLRAAAGAVCLWPIAVAADSDAMAVIVAVDSRHRVESRDQLAEIYRRRKQFWSDGQRIDPVNLPAADPLRRRFSLAVMGALPEQLEAFWNEMYFHGVLPPQVLKSVEAVLRIVATTPGAIGYIPLCAADKRVAIALAIDSAGAAVDKEPGAVCPH